MPGIADYIFSFFSSPSLQPQEINVDDLKKISTVEKEKAEKAEELQSKLNNKSLLKNAPLATEELTVSDIASMRTLADDISRDATDSVLIKRCHKFIEETESFTFVSKLIGLGREELIDREKIIDHLKIEYQSKGVLWIPISSKVVCRLDENTISIINVSETAKQFHQNALFTEKDSLDGGLSYREGIKTVKTFEHSLKEPMNINDFFKVMLNYCCSDQDLSFLYTSLPAYFELKEIVENDAQNHPDRYRSTRDSAPAAALFYSLNGLFDDDVCKLDNEVNLFEAKFCLLRQYCFHQKLHSFSPTDSTLSSKLALTEELSAECLDLIKTVRKLEKKGTASQEDFEVLYATYLDLVSAKKKIKADHQNELRKAAFCELDVNCELDFTCKDSETFGVIVPPHGGLGLSDSSEPSGSTKISKTEKLPILSELPPELTLFPKNADALISQLDLFHKYLSNINEAIELTETITVVEESRFEDVVFNISPDNVISKISFTAGIFRDSNDILQAAHASLSQLAINLPIPTHNSDDKNNLWNQLSEEQIQQILPVLENVGKKLYELDELYRLQRSGNGLAELGLLQFQILAATEALAKKSSSSRLGSFKVFNFPYFDFLRNPQLVIESPQLQQKALELALYFDPSFTFHQLVSEQHSSFEEYKEAILNSAMALFYIEDHGIFEENLHIYPFKWKPDPKSQTSQFYKQFFDLSSVQDCWTKMGDHAPKTEEDKLLWIVQEAINGTEILPSEIYVLQRSVVNCMNYAYGHSLQSTITKTHAFSSEVKGIFGTSIKTLNVLQNHISESVEIPSNVTPEMTEEFKKRPFSSPLYPHIKNTFFQIGQKLENTASSESTLYFGNQNEIEYKHATCFYTDYARKSFEQIGCNPLDSVNRSTGWYLQNIKSLYEHRYQNYFHDYLFQFQRLEAVVRSQPAFKARLKEFFELAVEQALVDKEYNTVSFLCNEMNKVHHYLEVRGLNTGDLKDRFPAAGEWLKEIFIPTIAEPKDLHCLYEILYKLSGPESEQALICSAVMLMTAEGISKAIEIDQEKLFTALYKRSDLRNLIFKTIASIYNIDCPSDEGATFDKDLGMLTSGSWSVDLYKGNIKDDKGFIYFCNPFNVLDPVQFARKYGIELYQVIPENYQEMYTESRNLEGVYFLKPKDPSLKLPEFQIAPDFQITRIKKGKCQQLIKQKYHKSFSANAPLLFPYGRCAFWIDTELLDTAEISVEIEGKPALTLTGTKSETECDIKEIKKDDKILCSINKIPPTLINYFLRFESLQNLEFWTKEGIVKKINLHSSNFSFSVDKKNRIHSDQHHGFYLAEDNKNAERLPFACPAMTLTDGKNFKYLLKPNEGSQWVEIDLVDGKFIGHNRFSQLYLAYFYVLEKKYSAAGEILSDILKITNLSKAELDVLNSIISYSPNDSANSLAIKLKAKLIIHEAQILPLTAASDSASISGSEEIFKDDYIKYLSQLHQIDGCALTSEEERQILSAAIKQLEPITQFSVKTSLWTYFLNNRYFTLFQDRLNSLTGTADVKIRAMPIPSKYLRTTIGLLNIDKLVTTLSSHDFLDGLSEAISIDPTVPPQLSEITSRFFYYYDFILSRANEQERKDFAKSLDLLIHQAESDQLAYLSALKEICKNPKGRPSLKDLKELLEKFKDAKKQVDDLAPKSTAWDKMSAKLKLIFAEKELKIATQRAVRFYWIRSITDQFSSITEIFKNRLSAWWNSYSKTRSISAVVSPWMRPFKQDKEKQYKFSERDLEITENHRKLVAEYFEEEKGEITPHNPIVETAGKTIFDRRLNKEKLNLAIYYAQQAKNKDWNYKKSSGDLKEWIKELKKETKERSTVLKTEHLQLLARANRVQNGHVDAAALRAALHKGLKGEELFSLFATATEKQFKAKTTFETDEDFQQFLIALTDHYIQVSRNKQMANVIKLLEKADKVSLDEADSFRQLERKAYLSEAAKNLLTAPAYTRGTGRKERILLAQEVSLGFLIREDQIEKVNEVLQEGEKNPELLVEAPLGWGKTEVFRTLLNVLKGDGANFVINLLPSTQELTLAEQLQQQSSLCFGKKITRLSATRETQFSVSQLEYIYERMLESIKLGRTEAVRPETYQALELQMLSLCYSDIPKIEMVQVDYNKKLELYLNILRTIRVEGWVAIEEENEVLNSKNKLIFALGERNTYNPRYAHTAKQLFDCILETPVLKDLFKLKENKQEGITENEFDTVFIPCLAEYFSKIYLLEGEDKELFKQFLSSPQDKSEFNKALQWAEKQENKDAFAFLKGIVQACLPIACKGRINAKDGYGLSRLHPKLKVPIPYLAKDTPKETVKGPSQYFPDVALLRSFFYYFAAGLKTDDVELMVEHMKKIADAEAYGRSIDTTQTSKEFAAFVKEAGLSPDKYKLSEIKGYKLKSLAEKFKHNEAVISYFVQHVVAPQIDIYPITLESSAQNLRSMFGSSLSLSATPQHAAAHGPRTKFIPMEGTSGSITHILLSKSGTVERARLNILHALDPHNSFEESANDIIKEHADTGICSALVEASPTFIDMSNAKIAALLAGKLKGNNRFKGVLFCDETDKMFKVYDFETGTIQLLKGSSYEEEALFKYYSPEDTFNTNWKSAISAYFKIVIGPNSTWEQIGQGAGRARLTRLMQTIGYEIHKQTLTKHFEGKSEIAPMEMLNFLLSNSAVAEAAHVFLSIPSQMDDEIRRTVLDKMYGLDMDRSRWKQNLKQSVDPLNAQKIFRGSQTVFVTQNSQDPWKMYSGMRKGCNPSEELSAYQNHCIRKVGDTNLDLLERFSLRRKLREYSKKWKEESGIPFPDTVPSISGNHNAQVEILQELEHERHIDTGINSYKHVWSYTPDVYPKDFNLFAPDWEKPSVLRHTAYKIISVVHPIFDKALKFFGKSMTKVYVGGYLGFVASIILIETAPTAAVAVFLASLAAIIGNGLALVTTGICSVSTWMMRAAIIHLNVTYDTHYVKNVVHDAVRKQTKRASKMFGYNYIVTNNKLKMWPGQFGREPQVPFNKDAKPLLHLLVIVDKKDGKETLTFVDGDQNDVHFWMTQLIEDNKNTSLEEAAKRTRHVAIYDVESEDTKISKARFTAVSSHGTDIFEKLLVNPAFHAGIAQAKLYNGVSKFTASELHEVPQLVQKIADDVLSNGKVAEDYFTGDALAEKDKDLLRKYTSMPLARVLNLSKAPLKSVA